MKLIYKDNENAALIFKPEKNNELANAAAIQIHVEEGDDEIEWHQKERYEGPRNETLKDPNGYKLVFAKTA